MTSRNCSNVYIFAWVDSPEAYWFLPECWVRRFVHMWAHPGDLRRPLKGKRQHLYLSFIATSGSPKLLQSHLSPTGIYGVPPFCLTGPDGQTPEVMWEAECRKYEWLIRMYPQSLELSCNSNVILSSNLAGRYHYPIFYICKVWFRKALSSWRVSIVTESVVKHCC